MELQDLIWIERFRPKTFDRLILKDKEKNVIKNYIKNSKLLPSFIFHSKSPGTGKTSTAKIIIDTLGCDSLKINSSDERGIETIREKVSLFAKSLSTNGIKRCIFLDEADGLTKQAQDSLRNLMETYSDNAFFIFSCNDITKIIDPIRSRCISINFQFPDKITIFDRMFRICKDEHIEGNIGSLVDYYYPDIRSMIAELQEAKLSGNPLEFRYQKFEDFLELIKKKDFEKIKDIVYSTPFNFKAFNKWFFDYIFQNYDRYGFENAKKIINFLAETEKYSTLNVNLEVIFIANAMEIAKLL